LLRIFTWGIEGETSSFELNPIKKTGKKRYSLVQVLKKEKLAIEITLGPLVSDGGSEKKGDFPLCTLKRGSYSKGKKFKENQEGGVRKQGWKRRGMRGKGFFTGKTNTQSAQKGGEGLRYEGKKGGGSGLLVPGPGLAKINRDWNGVGSTRIGGDMGKNRGKGFQY